jgi:ribosomal protein L24E
VTDGHVLPSFCQRRLFDGTGVLEDGGITRTVECVHDIRMVRAPEKLGWSALDHRGFSELGNRFLRIFDPSTGKPNRLHATEPRPIKDFAGGHHTDRLCALRPLLHAAATETRLPLGGNVYPGCGVLRFPLVRLINWPQLV